MSKPPTDRPGWRLKLAVLVGLVLISFATICLLAHADQGEAATAIGVTVTGVCAVLVAIWKT